MSTVNDITTGNIFHISKPIAEFISKKDFFYFHRNIGIPGLLEFFEVLLQHKMITAMSLSNFVKDYEIFHSFNNVDHCIIDYSDTSTFSVGDLQRNLSLIGVRHVQFRFFSNNYLQPVLEGLETALKCKLNIVSYELLVNFYSTSLLQQLIDALIVYNRLRSIVVFYSSEKPELDFKSNSFIIHFVKGVLTDNRCCGYISRDYFILNRLSYNEGKSFNSCLNKKISIDTNGNIKNCPSMPESYGNIKNTTLEEAINKPGFKKYWNVTKDQIDVCKDCEFRYVCTDCRAYTERTVFKEDLDLSKPLKCGYNPYTNEWAEWSTNPLKEKAIAYYGMDGLVKKND